MAVCISITLDDELAAELDVAAAEGSRSAFVADAVREHLARLAVDDAIAWHASLTGADAADFADFNAAR
ncbi:ribbon-helix-helix domain-containing protein [Actinoplanes sp. NPDC051851]|uniref:ribbon-helix-helix domain-containing protein n=1 Tax=Actinoplanes sp. NPDC051851 TaxID=3154753 RepID=UPI0034429624